MFTIPIQVLYNKKNVIKYHVNESKTFSCAETIASRWKKKKKKNTQRLMPDDDTLNTICYCANYLAYFQKNFQLNRHPSPIGNGWEIIDGKCRPARNVLPALPSGFRLQTAMNDDENTDYDIDECSGTDSSEYEDNE